MKQKIMMTTVTCGDNFSFNIDSVYVTNENNTTKLVAIGKLDWLGGDINSTVMRIMEASVEIENLSSHEYAVEDIIVEKESELKELQAKYENDLCLYNRSSQQTRCDTQPTFYKNNTFAFHSNSSSLNKENTMSDNNLKEEICPNSP